MKHGERKAYFTEHLLIKSKRGLKIPGTRSCHMAGVWMVASVIFVHVGLMTDVSTGKV